MQSPIDVISGGSDKRVLRVLVVEDEALIAMMLEDTLADLGHKVLEVVTSVRSALSAIDARSAEIDAAVLDANLGGVSADPVAAALRAAGIPFILASGYEGEDLRRLGFNEPCLRKPYRPDDIDRALRTLIER